MNKLTKGVDLIWFQILYMVSIFSLLYVSTQCHRERRNCGLSRHFKIQIYSCLQRILLVRSFLCMYIRNGYQFSRVEGEHILNWILPILILNLITISTFAPYNFLIREGKKRGGGLNPHWIFSLTIFHQFYISRTHSQEVLI